MVELNAPPSSPQGQLANGMPSVLNRRAIIIPRIKVIYTSPIFEQHIVSTPNGFILVGFVLLSKISNGVYLCPGFNVNVAACGFFLDRLCLGCDGTIL